jgi:hypothetical protein
MDKIFKKRFGPAHELMFASSWNNILGYFITTHGLVDFPNFLLITIQCHLTTIDHYKLQIANRNTK